MTISVHDRLVRNGRAFVVTAVLADGTVYTRNETGRELAHDGTAIASAVANGELIIERKGTAD